MYVNHSAIFFHYYCFLWFLSIAKKLIPRHDDLVGLDITTTILVDEFTTTTTTTTTTTATTTTTKKNFEIIYFQPHREKHA